MRRELREAVDAALAQLVGKPKQPETIFQSRCRLSRPTRATPLPMSAAPRRASKRQAGVDPSPPPPPPPPPPLTDALPPTLLPPLPADVLSILFSHCDIGDVLSRVPAVSTTWRDGVRQAPVALAFSDERGVILGGDVLGGDIDLRPGRALKLRR